MTASLFRSTRAASLSSGGATGRVSRALLAHPVALGLVLGALSSAGLGLGLAQAAADPTDILPLSEVKPGMKGYGRTVFSGTAPEKFEVEVISVLRNFRPNQDLILIKTPNHPRLDAARTVAGMSGSPIYLNDKMIGAYAYGWLFGVEPVAGVTPIKSMLEELARPVPKALLPGRGGPLPGSQPAAPTAERPKHQFVGSIDSYTLESHRAQLASWSATSHSPPVGTNLAKLSAPVMVGGLGTTGMQVVQSLFASVGLEPVQAGGGGSSTPASDAPTKFVDGGAIGVEFVRGDISMMGLGTVTRVSGDKLLAFGHPMMNGGIEAFPTAIAKVHWFLASQQRSFKIGESVRSLGALINDRQAAIVVDSSLTAPTFPVKLRIEGVEGAPKTDWSMTVTLDEFMTPSLVAAAIGNAVETTTSERRDSTWRIETKIKTKGHGTITVKDFTAGAGAAPVAMDMIGTDAVRAVGMLLNNPWESVEIESVDCTIKGTFAREVAILRGVKLLDGEVDPGESARIQIEVENWKGKRETRVLEVPMPKELAGQEVSIEILPGWDVMKPMPTPSDVAGLVALLGAQSYDQESVVARYRLPGAGATSNGKVANRLPAGAIDTLVTSADSATPEVFASFDHVVVPLKKFFLGRDSVRVKVRSVLR